MSGALSIPFAILTLFLTGYAKLIFAISAYFSLWVTLFEIGRKSNQESDSRRQLADKLTSESAKRQELTNNLAAESDKCRNLTAQLSELLKQALEIEFAFSDSGTAKIYPCQIFIRNKSQIRNAEDLNVELVSFTDEFEGEYSDKSREHFRPKLPLALKSRQANKSINPGDGLEFFAFNIQMGTKVDGRVRTFVATFNLDNKSTAIGPATIFHEHKTYQIKFSASASKMARIEREFEMTFADDGGRCRINLSPIRELTESEKIAKKQRADTAVEQLVKFGQLLLSRVSFIKGIEPNKYNPDNDNETWDAIHQAAGYIIMMLNGEAAKVFDDGIATIHGSTLPHNKYGSTMCEDRYDEILAKLERRFRNLKTIVDGIDRYIK